MRLSRAGVRVDVEPANEPLGPRIRRAKLEKLPYVLVVGDSDVAGGTVGVNARGSEAPLRDVAVEDFVSRLTAEIADKTAPEAGAVGVR
jgi:threonyl-tRNA synthetase